MKIESITFSLGSRIWGSELRSLGRFGALIGLRDSFRLASSEEPGLAALHVDIHLEVWGSLAPKTIACGILRRSFRIDKQRGPVAGLSIGIPYSIVTELDISIFVAQLHLLVFEGLTLLHIYLLKKGMQFDGTIFEDAVDSIFETLPESLFNNFLSSTEKSDKLESDMFIQKWWISEMEKFRFDNSSHTIKELEVFERQLIKRINEARKD